MNRTVRRSPWVLAAAAAPNAGSKVRALVKGGGPDPLGYAVYFSAYPEVSRRLFISRTWPSRRSSGRSES